MDKALVAFLKSQIAKAEGEVRLKRLGLARMRASLKRQLRKGRARAVAAVLVALCVPVVASAQAPLLPGQQIAFEINPGQTRSGTNPIVRPEANVVFEYRVNGGAPIAAVKASPCVATTPAPMLTCRLVPPTLAQGEHAIEIRALVSPTEAGVSPSAYMPPLAVAVILVTSPGTPTNGRLVMP